MPISDLNQDVTTDAEHLQNIAGVAAGIQQLAEQLAEYIAACQAKGMDEEALTSLSRAMEMLAEAGDACANASMDFENAYAGVRETAASGKTIIGDNGPVNFWTGEGR
jgi:hypothetical protein